jgi:hypothetical protein
LRKSFPSADLLFWGAPSRGTDFSFKDAQHASEKGDQVALSRKSFSYPWADLPKADNQGTNTWDFRRDSRARASLTASLRITICDYFHCWCSL